MKIREYTTILAMIISVALIACGGGHTGENADDMSSDTEKSDMHSSDKADHDHEAMKKEAGSNEFMAAPEDARVFFVNLKDGDQVTSPVKVEMGVEGMTVHPAGEVIEGTGHHHIILSSDYVPAGEAVPADDTHIHFGGGQTETEVELEPGTHTLTLQFADGLHRSYGKSMSASVTIEVTE